MRSLALLAAGLVGGGATLLSVGLAPTAYVAAAGAATCTSSGGVSVVVDYRELGGGTVTACSPNGGASAASIFASVGVEISYATRQPGFVCRVNGVPAADPCVNASPANAYWGLWWSDGSTGSWTYASAGVGGQTIPAGGSVGWAWQQDRGGSPAAPSVAPPLAPASPTPTQTPTASPTASPTSSPTTPGSGGSGGSGGDSGGGKGGKGGSTSPTSSPSATPSATPSGSPSGTPSSTPSQSPLASESPSDSPSSTPTKKPSVRSESPSDSPSSDPSEEPPTSSESPSDSTPSASGQQGAQGADEPARIPAAVTWSIVGLLAAGIAASALVARRRRGSGAP